MIPMGSSLVAAPGSGYRLPLEGERLPRRDLDPPLGGSLLLPSHARCMNWFCGLHLSPPVRSKY